MSSSEDKPYSRYIYNTEIEVFTIDEGEHRNWSLMARGLGTFALSYESSEEERKQELHVFVECNGIGHNWKILPRFSKKGSTGWKALAKTRFGLNKYGPTFEIAFKFENEFHARSFCEFLEQEDSEAEKQRRRTVSRPIPRTPEEYISTEQAAVPHNYIASQQLSPTRGCDETPRKKRSKINDSPKQVIKEEEVEEKQKNSFIDIIVKSDLYGNIKVNVSSDATVFGLKIQLWEKLKLLPDQQTLLVSERILEDDELLSLYSSELGLITLSSNDEKDKGMSLRKQIPPLLNEVNTIPFTHSPPESMVLGDPMTDLTRDNQTNYFGSNISMDEESPQPVIDSQFEIISIQKIPSPLPTQQKQRTLKDYFSPRAPGHPSPLKRRRPRFTSNHKDDGARSRERNRDSTHGSKHRSRSHSRSRSRSRSRGKSSNSRPRKVVTHHKATQQRGMGHLSSTKPPRRSQSQQQDERGYRSNNFNKANANSPPTHPRKDHIQQNDQPMSPPPRPQRKSSPVSSRTRSKRRNRISSSSTPNRSGRYTTPIPGSKVLHSYDHTVDALSNSVNSVRQVAGDGVESARDGVEVARDGVEAVRESYERVGQGFGFLSKALD